MHVSHYYWPLLLFKIELSEELNYIVDMDVRVELVGLIRRQGTKSVAWADGEWRTRSASGRWLGGE